MHYEDIFSHIFNHICNLIYLHLLMRTNKEEFCNFGYFTTIKCRQQQIVLNAQYVVIHGFAHNDQLSLKINYI